MGDMYYEMKTMRERLIVIHDQIVDLFPNDAECAFNAAMALEGIKGE